jgi:hypothetical protein
MDEYNSRYLLEKAGQRMNRAIDDVFGMFEDTVTDPQAIAITRIANALNTISALLVDIEESSTLDKGTLRQVSDLLRSFGERISAIDNDWTKLAQDCARNDP